MPPNLQSRSPREAVLKPHHSGCRSSLTEGGAAAHSFTDTVSALREIGRTMEEGASLAVMTFTAGKKGVLRFRHIRQHTR